MIEVDFLKELDRFNLALKKNSVELKQGEQSSNSTGQGMIFEDHKKYTPGDDIRKMDWKAYARTGDLYIKRFEEEKSVTVHILIDRSSSMDYGEAENKYDFASKLGLGIAHMVSNTNDRFRFSVFSETVTDISSGRRNADLASLVDTLNNLRKTPESKIGNCLSDYGSRIRNKSVVVVLSDFLVDIEEIEDGLASLQNTDTILVNTLDSSEISPDMEGDKILKDPESGSTLRTYLSKRIRSSYEQKMEKHTSEVEETARKYGAEYVKVNTGEDFFDAFSRVWGRLNRD
ncbi:DUF58 domain-containing protein [Candidatus Nanohalococcus occultus]|uniref:DUF58 family protein n=1 Tax=Candidatus Nanohalococcus occultus TaxID=2978047 RepID=A0ABY8CKK8_9ARCH|nr:DUF58 family protein [Candidatus Nanohaloarchaeota archaeon SVXNc]